MMSLFSSSRGDVPVLDRATPLLLDPDVISSSGYLLPVDKDLSWSSFDVVARIRNLTGIRKVGHAGTLDPLATGLLIVCLGRATKVADDVQIGRKEYTGTIRLGERRTTDDREGEVVERASYDTIKESDVLEVSASFVGSSLQIPPMYSARKVKGKRLYELAREGKEVERGAAEIEIYDFEVVAVALPDIRFRVVCSRGTYIRSVARDFGQRLGSLGYLADLRRTRSGDISVDDARTIGDIVEEYGRISLD